MGIIDLPDIVQLATQPPDRSTRVRRNGASFEHHSGSLFIHDVGQFFQLIVYLSKSSNQQCRS